MISILVQLNIGRPQLGHTIIANCIIFETFDPEICSFLIFFKMRLGQLLQDILCMIFQEKHFSCYILLLTKFDWLVALTSLNIGKNVYRNYLLSSDLINLQNNLRFLVKHFLT